MSRDRLLWADSLKGILILLVILGHSIQNTISDECYTNHLWNIIYSFHMPAFMAISGFLYYRRDKSDVSWYRVILRRFRQLVIPFMLWTFLLLLSNNRLNSMSIVEYILYPDKGLWFLWALFVISVLFVIGDFLSKMTKIKQEVVMIAISVLLSLTMIYLEIRVFSFQFIAYYFLFYIVGYYIHKYYDSIKVNEITTAVLTILWGFLAWFWHMKCPPTFLQVLPLPNVLLLYI